MGQQVQLLQVGTAHSQVVCVCMCGKGGRIGALMAVLGIPCRSTLTLDLIEQDGMGEDGEGGGGGRV